MNKELDKEEEEDYIDIPSEQQEFTFTYTTGALNE